MKCHRLDETDPARIRNCCKNLFLFCGGNESRGVRPEGDPFGHLAFPGNSVLQTILRFETQCSVLSQQVTCRVVTI